MGLMRVILLAQTVAEGSEGPVADDGDGGYGREEEHLRH